MQITNIPSGPLYVNTYIVADEETKKGFIVDPGGYNANTVRFIQKEGIEIEYIILTHGHGDHIGGVEQYRKEYPQAKLVAHKKEAELLADPRLNMSFETMYKAISLAADIWVEEGDTLQVGNMTLKFLFTPGHTPGGMSIVVGDVVFSGDTLFELSIGRTDFAGGSFEVLSDSIRQKLYTLPDDTKVFPGHMGPTKIGFEKKSNPFVCMRSE